MNPLDSRHWPTLGGAPWPIVQETSPRVQPKSRLGHRGRHLLRSRNLGSERASEGGRPAGQLAPWTSWIENRNFGISFIGLFVKIIRK